MNENFYFNFQNSVIDKIKNFVNERVEAELTLEVDFLLRKQKSQMSTRGCKGACETTENIKIRKYENYLIKERLAKILKKQNNN